MKSQERKRLKYRQSRKNCIQTMNFLLFFDEGIKLCHTFQSELVHKINIFAILHKLIAESLDRGRECRRE